MISMVFYYIAPFENLNYIRPGKVGVSLKMNKSEHNIICVGQPLKLKEINERDRKKRSKRRMAFERKCI